MPHVALMRMAAAATAMAMLGACAQTSPGSTSATPASEQSILESSTPAAGSIVAAPVNELVLNFNPPARLKEVTLEGPEGVMPTMVTSIGEVPRYSVPLAGLGPGKYTVRWEASVGTDTHTGSFGFTVR